MNLTRVVFFVSRRAGAREVAEKSAALLDKAGISLCAPREYSRSVPLPGCVELVDDDACMEGADLALVIGGDGSILRANYFAAPLGVPILGINMGRLGFLSELEPDETELLSKLIDGQYSIETRMMLSVSIRREHRYQRSTQGINK